MDVVVGIWNMGDQSTINKFGNLMVDVWNLGFGTSFPCFFSLGMGDGDGDGDGILLLVKVLGDERIRCGWLLQGGEIHDHGYSKFMIDKHQNRPQTKP